MNPKILMIEDDASICDMTKMNLNMNGFQHVYCASDGEEGLALAAQLVPDLILLDVMLPGIDGLTVCRNLKNNPALADIPIIMLTAKGEENDIVLGLEMGADDYVTKPYSSKVLAARIAARLRKKSAGGKAMQAIVLGALAIDLTAYSATLGGQPLMLTADEFKTLALLAANPGKVFRRQLSRHGACDRHAYGQPAPETRRLGGPYRNHPGRRLPDFRRIAPWRGKIRFCFSFRRS